MKQKLYIHTIFYPLFGLGLFLFLLTFLVDFGKPCAYEIRGILLRFIILTIVSVFYGISRAAVFNPRNNKKYMEWLALTPWQADKPLPLGPVHIVWRDIGILAIMFTMAWFWATLPPQYNELRVYGVGNPVSIIAVFLAIYIACLLLTIPWKQQPLISAAILFLIPWTVFPFKNIYFAMFVLLAIYGLVYKTIRLWLKDFPWNTEFWNENRKQKLLTTAISKGVIGPPQRVLNHPIIYYNASKYNVPWKWTLIFATICAWWVFVLGWIKPEDKQGNVYVPALLVMIIQAVVLLVIRTILYFSGTLPPISLIGRIITKNWIIPRYDKALIAPLLTLIITTSGILITYKIGTTHNAGAIILAATTFLVWLITLKMPPGLEEWRFTGCYRVDMNRITQPHRSYP